MNLARIMLLWVLTCGMTVAGSRAVADEGFASTTQMQMSEQELLAVLTGDAPPAQRALACKRLAVVGTEASAGVLRELLDDPQLASWARIALAAIPGPKIDAALLDAAKSLEGRALLGVIDTLGRRGDQGAAEALIAHLQGDDLETATAAAAALGRLGGAPASEQLQLQLASPQASLRGAAAQACVRCAEQLHAAGQNQQATALYDRVRLAEVAWPRRAEALRGAILVRGTEGTEMLQDLLRADNLRQFRLGLTILRELDDSVPLEPFAALWDSLQPSRRAVLLLALADRWGAQAAPLVQRAAGDRAAEVRAASLDAMATIDAPELLPTLLAIAAGDDATQAENALQVVRNLGGPDIDAALEARFASASGSERKVLLKLFGWRAMGPSAALKETLHDSDADIRAAAVTALGATIDASQLPLLIRYALEPIDARDQTHSLEAVRAASIRMADRDACAGQLGAALQGATAEVQTSLLKTLGEVGGSTALEAVAMAARDGSVSVQDTATRVLGEWMTADAAGPLDDIAARQGDSPYRVRALRGYLRIARQFDLPIEQRMAMCRRALAIATRGDEKLLALEILKRYPSLEGLSLAVEASDEEAIRPAAEAAAREIAAKLPPSAEGERQLELLKAAAG